MKHNSQSGSVFFIILLGIMMFAALSYAVLQGSRNSTSMMGQDQAKLMAQDIATYANTIVGAVQKLKLSGCTDLQMSFTNTVWLLGSGTAVHPTSHNAAAPGDGSCAVFATTGGKVNAMNAPAKSFFTATPSNTDPALGAFRVSPIVMPGVGTGEPDLVLVMPWVERTTCMSINTLNGVSNETSTPPQAVESNIVLYTGTYPTVTPDTLASNTKTAGQTSYCVTDNSNTLGSDRFYRVLIAR